MDFEAFPKIPRLNREIIITEKLDGTNAQVMIDDRGNMVFGNRTRWIAPELDNHGFALWGVENAAELRKLGPGRHFGEWWGGSIQKRYGQFAPTKRFSLFNASRWADDTVRPACCEVVPVLYRGAFSEFAIEGALDDLRSNGSRAAPGCMKPEGIIVFHTAANSGFKVTLEKDSEWKGKEAA